MKVKILVDAHVFDYSYQGTSTYIEGLYKEMSKDERFHITLCAVDVDHLKDIFQGYCFEYLPLKSKSSVFRLAIEIPRIIAKYQFDYAHFQYVIPLVKRCKYIVTVHDLLFLDYPSYFPWHYRLKNYLLFRYAIKKSEVVLTVSNYSKNRIEQHFGSHLSVSVTPNAVETLGLNAKTGFQYNSKREKWVLCVSRFENRKNQIGLYRSFKRLNLSKFGYKLVFVGHKSTGIDKSSFDLFMNQIDKSDLEYIIFYEGISKQDLKELYSRVEVFVYPSFAEGFGVPPIEAALYGCKVMCSNLTAMSDFSFFNYHFDPKDNDLFDDMLQRIITDEEYPYAEIKLKIMENYSWFRSAKEMSLRILDDFGAYY